MTRQRLTLALLFSVLSVAVSADEPPRWIEARVTLLREGEIRLDKGAGAGVRVGDRVRVWSEPQALGRVVAVDAIGARAVLEKNADAVADDDRAEIAVRAAAAPEYDDSPWQWERPVPRAEEGEPLLAPVFERTAKDRPRAYSGRVTMYLFANQNLEEDDQRSYSARLGTDVRVRNPFGQGGELRLDADGTTRVSEASDRDRKDETDLRIDRLYYRWGGNEGDSTELHFGRFYPVLASEIGLHDGVEAVVRLGARTRVGVSAGALPEPSHDRSSAEDVGVTLSYEYMTPGREFWRLAAALHQSWHDGDRDRTLLLLTANGRPHEDVLLFAQAWLDHYDSDDVIKSEGVELTELLAHASWQLHDDHRVRLAHVRLVWPELLRSEFEPVTAELVDENELMRTTLSSDHRLHEKLRLQLRVSAWEDQDDDGTTGEVRFRFPELLYERTDVECAIFVSDGRGLDGPGARLSFRQSLGPCAYRLAYEFRQYEFESLLTGSDTESRHRIYGSFDWYLDSSWYVSLSADYATGGDEQFASGSLLIQYRF